VIEPAPTTIHAPGGYRNENRVAVQWWVASAEVFNGSTECRCKGGCETSYAVIFVSKKHVAHGAAIVQSAGDGNPKAGHQVGQIKVASPTWTGPEVGLAGKTQDRSWLLASCTYSTQDEIDQARGQ